MNKISAVPTNIITGFLGVGKTSAILHLLKHKPENERWAVLVNEFGEIGVDGGLVQGQQGEAQGVFIREVPGGCMCCAAGVPMQVTLNQLVAKANPDRLLIEPTGLGHPEEVLHVLKGGSYHELLSLQKVITLVDARHLADTRYTEHSTFNQQIAMADLVVGNKADLYQAEDQARLEAYVKEKGRDGAQVLLTEQGALSLAQLTGDTEATATHAHHHHHHHHHHHESESPLASDKPLPECGYLSAENSGEGFNSIGWRFAAEKTFKRSKVFWFLNGLEVERMKAVFRTDDGIYGYNLTLDTMTETQLEAAEESRIEIITTALDETWEAQLLACLQ